MAKPLSEHEATLRGRKKKRGKRRDEAVHAIEYVPGGGVRRIIYDADAMPTHVHAAPAPEPQPETEPDLEPEPEEPVMEFQETPPAPSHGDARDVIYNAEYMPQHMADMDHIRFEVDNLHMMKERYRRGYAGRSDPAWSRDVYSTDRGAVRESYSPEQRVLYTTRREGHRERESRFSHAQVDRVISGVDLHEEQVITEKVTDVETRRVPKPKARPKPKPRAKHPYDYKGDVHEVVDLEGIGPAYADRLHAMGIHNTQELLFASTSDLAAATKAPAKTVEQWKSMAQLVKVNGIGPQYAEALARGGVTSLEDLKKRSPAQMAKDVNDYLEGLNVNVLGQTVSQKRISSWQKKAKPMRRVPIDMDKIQVRALESKAAIADAKSAKAAPPAKPAAKAAPKTAGKAAAKATTCAAKTASGTPCKRPPRAGSKYCASHKGYRA